MRIFCGPLAFWKQEKLMMKWFRIRRFCEYYFLAKKKGEIFKYQFKNFKFNEIILG